MATNLQLWVFKGEEESKMSTIHWLPSTSIFNNNASGSLILGQPGAGKSFFLLNTIQPGLIKYSGFSSTTVVPCVDKNTLL